MAFKTLFPSGKVSLKEFTSFFSALFPFGKTEDFCTHLYECIRTQKNIVNIQEDPIRDSVVLGTDMETASTKFPAQIELPSLVSSFTIIFKGSTKERCRWIFQFYDKDKNGKVTKEELYYGILSINKMLENSLLNEISIDTTIKEIFEIRKLRRDFLVLEDFEALATNHNQNFKKLGFF